MLSFTPIGFFRGAVTDNITAAKIAEKSGQKVTFGGFTKIGFPIMIGTVCDAAVFAMVDNHEAHKPIAVETVKAELKLDAAALSAAAEKKLISKLRLRARRKTAGVFIREQRTRGGG